MAFIYNYWKNALGAAQDSGDPDTVHVYWVDTAMVNSLEKYRILLVNTTSTADTEFNVTTITGTNPTTGGGSAFSNLQEYRAGPYPDNGYDRKVLTTRTVTAAAGPGGTAFYKSAGVSYTSLIQNGSTTVKGGVVYRASNNATVNNQEGVPLIFADVAFAPNGTNVTITWPSSNVWSIT